MTDKIVVYNTCGSEAEASQMALRLVEAGLAACVNVVAPVRSYYRWQGKTEVSGEWMLIIKTSRRLFDRVRALIENTHSYQLPEVLAVPVVDGSPAYLAWFDEGLLDEGLHHEGLLDEGLIATEEAKSNG